MVIHILHIYTFLYTHMSREFADTFWTACALVFNSMYRGIMSGIGHKHLLLVVNTSNKGMSIVLDRQARPAVQSTRYRYGKYIIM